MSQNFMVEVEKQGRWANEVISNTAVKETTVIDRKFTGYRFKGDQESEYKGQGGQRSEVIEELKVQGSHS